MKKNKILAAALIFFSTFFAACNSSTVEDIKDIVDGVDRKPIDKNSTGLNAFAEEREFGTPCEQFIEIRDVLGLRFVRILFNWSSAVQPTPASAINFSFYDSIAACIPNGMDALVVLNELPSWMSNRQNWIDNNPRLTFVKSWVEPVVRRYRRNSRIIGFQILNEPNMKVTPENQLLDVAENATNYVELLAAAHNTVKDLAPNKLVVNAATTSIVQNYPDTLNYNKQMVEAGALNFVDRYAIHYYGMQFENLIRPRGVADFLDSLNTKIWVTESGKQGMTEQRAYVETVWPYLNEKVPNIERFYYYQFISRNNPAEAYGLKNPSQSQPVSDLYLWLRG